MQDTYTNNGGVQLNDSYAETIIYGDNTKIVANYKQHHIETYPSKFAVIKKPLIFSFTTFSAYIALIANYSAIVDFLKQSSIPLTLLWSIIICLTPFVVVGIIKAKNIWRFLPHLFNMTSERGAYNVNNKYYINPEDQNIYEYSVSADCPIHGCTGRIIPRELNPESSLEGVRFAGICNKMGIQHSFEYHEDTMVGIRLKITPTSSQKK